MSAWRMVGARRAIGLVRTWLAFATMLCALPAAAQPAQKCFVADPELQGSYAGGCKDGKAEGQGTAKGSATYVGEFRAGLKQGRGVKTWPWGDRYEGGFADDAKHGMGSYTWGARSAFAGDRYEGEFRNDKRYGAGVYAWASGDIYAGPWKDDVVNGQATQRMIARYRATRESLTAMANAGVKVCKASTVGSGATARPEGSAATTRPEGSAATARTEGSGATAWTEGSGATIWTEGEIVAVNQKTLQVAVRITKSVETPLVVAGVEVAVGESVWDDPLNWIPCD